MNGLLIKWLDNFRTKFGHLPDAQPYIKRVEEALALYQEAIVKTEYKVEIAKTIEDRSILEYGLDYHLPRFVEAVSFLLIH